MNFRKSGILWTQAERVLVGGVNSPVRAFKAVGGQPFFVSSGRGARILDVDGNEFVDYVLSWGPLILGHAHPHVVEAVTRAMEKGASFGIPTEAEVRLAERIIAHMPSIEKVRFVNSGTEASMSAIRLARGYKQRDLVLKIEGCYHGHVDDLLIKAGSGPTTLGTPTSAGIPQAHASNTLVAPFNDLEAVRVLFEAHPNEVAAVVLEPVAGNMGVVPPNSGYLRELRRLTCQYDALLIFDEVMTGFRVSLGGAQERYGVTPDLTILGKVIGGGLPIGAYGGPATIMDMISPLGPVYQAGTLSGNPLATAAGLATLEIIEQQAVFESIERHTATLCEGFRSLAQEAGIPIHQTQVGTMAGLFFKEGPVRNYAEALSGDTRRYSTFFWGMLKRGAYFAPSQFEAFFLSTSHGSMEIDLTLSAAAEAFKEIHR